MERYGRCPFIRFREFLGKQTPFLIQNICPVTKKYINNVYLDVNNNPIKIDDRIAKDIITNARTVLVKGSKLVLQRLMILRRF